jgi:putative ABC transport system substrate-binding protein
MIRRREFVTLLGGAAAWPLTARAQQGTLPVIGFVHPTSPAASGYLAAAFRKGLMEAGYAENRNVAIEYRWAEGQYDRLPALVEDLVRRQVSVIVAVGGDPPVVAAKAATSTIPIVFNSGSDPVKLGLVASLNRPGGNITGAVQMTGALGLKQLELLRELVPPTGVIGMLANPTNPSTETRWMELKAAAHLLGQDIRRVDAASESDLRAAFATLVRMRAGALLLVGDGVLLGRRNQIVALAAQHALPAIYSRREYPDAGGLMSYGASITDTYRQVGETTGRILKGAKPADLPVQQSTRLELVLNLKTAKTLGLEIPPTLLARADEVIE